MTSIPFLDDDLLKPPGRVFMAETRIRIIPASEDPRLFWPNKPSISEQPPPKQDVKNFPLLVSNLPTSRRADQKPTPLTHAYSHVLLYGTNCARILEKLPVELREMIWEARMRADGVFDNSEVDFFGDYIGSGCRFLPRLCFVSKSLRDETIGVFMRNSIFRITSIESNMLFRKFIASVANGQDHVRKLYLNYPDFLPNHDSKTTSWALELAVACRGLHSLRLCFGRWQREDFDEDTQRSVFKWKTAEEVVKEHQLHRLLDCNKLRMIYWDQTQFRCPADTFIDLANWAKDEFEKINRNVENVVIGND